MVPAHQRLHAANPLAFDRDLGLVENLEFLFFQGMAHFVFYRQAAGE